VAVVTNTITLARDPTDPADQDLTAVLEALGVPYTTDGPRIQILVDQATDARLEAVIDSLARIRWNYTPGRTLQMALRLDPALEPDVA